MTVRIGVDLDGTLADLSAAFRTIETTLFGMAADQSAPADAGEPAETQPSSDPIPETTTDRNPLRDAARRRDRIWQVARATEDFWMSLQPIEPDVIRRLHELALTRKWDVFFLTQRPRTAGDTVLRQTQRWLAAHGFEMPSVLPLAGSRGRAAAALELNFLIDDLPKNCLDVIADSDCRPILVVRGSDEAVQRSAKSHRIPVVRSVSEALDLLEHPSRLSHGGIRRFLETLGLG
jgi:hypothetical protein